MKKRLNGRTVFYILNILLPLAGGFAVYLLFSPDSYIAEAAEKAGLAPAGLDLRPGRMLRTVRNFAPDVLWAYALAFSVSAVTGSGGKGTVCSAAICVLFASAVELSQKAGIISGTFDILDILFESAAIICAACISAKYEEKQHEKNIKNSFSRSRSCPFCRDGDRQREQQ